MLELRSIRKAYTTGNFTQVALDGVSVAFRDNEFVAVLGPSGSGKTTMLNIVGGLDTYDSGDLVIDGISTKSFKDRDWDAYRNNRVGFVFQSYNLIPHQTVLANVELALTLSGVGRKERQQRAKEALARVGLSDHIHKKPNQLSGGQMQRVAIARALVNNPEILLADEPTGALDSKTSVQIMDLLTEIARDRLVVMVTHNPELAQFYATRTVTLADGRITSDTHPFDPRLEARRAAKPPRRTSMSFFTALALSFNNLLTKKGRTLMTAFAGSIGIIGIAAILAVANGTSEYIASVEEETLAEYPLQITESTIDMTSMLVSSTASSTSEEGEGEDAEDTAEETSGDMPVAERTAKLFGSVGTNDLASLKDYLDNTDTGIEQYTTAVEYEYDVEPQIYLGDTETYGIYRIHPNSSLSALGIGSSSSSSSFLSSAYSSISNLFYQLPSNSALYEDQYEVLAGRWPQNSSECVLVLSRSGAITDFELYNLGLRDRSYLDQMIDDFSNGEEVERPEFEKNTYSYEDVLGYEFKVVTSADLYAYDESTGLWIDKSEDEEYLEELLADAKDLVVTGIVKPAGDGSAMLSPGFNYLADLTVECAESAAESPAVAAQMADPETNIFTGKAFGAEDDDSSLNFESMFSVNGETLQAAFNFDTSSINLDMGGLDFDLSSMEGLFDLSDLDFSDLPSIDSSAFNSIELDVDQEKLWSTAMTVAKAYTKTLFTFNEYGFLVDIKAPTKESIQEYLNQEDVKSSFTEALGIDAMQEQLAATMQDYLQNTLATYLEQKVAALANTIATSISDQVSLALETTMYQLSSSLSQVMNVDEELIASAFEMNIDEDELVAMMSAMMKSSTSSYENNLAKLGYCDLNEPSEISIYPTSFENKEQVKAIIDAYNDECAEAGKDDQVIAYTDTVGLLMTSVTDIIDKITMVLIAFVAISLVVSSIMIGVITYISVLERKKEIGILRAMGASKRNIGNVFNAETIIIGFVAGLLGVGITAAMAIPANAIVLEIADVKNLVSLPPMAAVILIAISVALTFLSGLIPSSAASRKDPVEALRSE